MLKIQWLVLFLVCGSIVVFSGCSKDEKKDAQTTGDSVENAYGRTTDALREAVEGVNDAVYK
jgi:molybdopterin synthase catalytic subunit